MFEFGQLALAQAAKAFLSINLVVGLALLLTVSHATMVHGGVNSEVTSSGPAPFKSVYTVMTDDWQDGDEKKYVIRPIIPPFIYKFHFVFSFAMFLFIALMVVSESQTARALLLLPVVLCYGVAHLLFAADQAQTVGEIMENYKRRISQPEDGG